MLSQQETAGTNLECGGMKTTKKFHPQNVLCEKVYA